MACKSDQRKKLERLCRYITRPAIAERQAQLCVYHRGERVVDLWADKIGDSNHSADSIANVFSNYLFTQTIICPSLHNVSPLLKEIRPLVSIN